MATFRVTVEHTGMGKERPWWLPTAVLVAPACALAFWLIVEFERGLPWTVVGGVSFLALVLPFIDLARREDRFSDRTRPPDLNRWGFEREVHPWRELARLSVAGSLLIGALVAYVALVSVAADAAQPLLVVLAVMFVFAAVATWWWWISKSGLQWDKRPEWQTAFIRRWPITIGVGQVVFAGSLLAGCGWALARGEWFPAGLGIVFFADVFLRALIRLIDRKHPDRNWGTRVTA